MRRTLIIVFLAFLFLALRVEHSSLFYDLGRDKRYQMIAAGNLAEGKGLSHCITFADDISKVSCQELTWWSAGYPIVLAGIYKLTDDLVTADFILLILGSLGFLLVSLRFFSIWIDFETDYWIVALFLAFAAFSFTPFNYLGTTTDLLSTVFLLFAITESAIGFRDRRSSKFVIAGAAAFAAVFFKFSFFPFLVVVPAGLGLLALLRREGAPLKYAAVFIGLLCVAFVILYVALPNYVLPPGGIMTPGWRWHNLLAQDPFGARALFFIDFLFRRIDKATTVGSVVYGLIQIFSIAVVAGFGYIAVRYAGKHFRSGENDGRLLSSVLCVLTAFLLVGYLCWLSIRVQTVYHPLYIPWTFVQETRYYAPAMVLLIYGVFIAPLYLRSCRPFLRLASLALVLAVCSFAVAFWGYKNYDYFYNGRVEGSFIGPHKDDTIVAEFLRNDTSLDRGKTVLGFLSYAEAYGYSTLLIEADPAVSPFPWYDWYVGSIPVATTQPRTLLVTIDKSLNGADREILNKYNGTRLLELSTYDLYRLEIPAEPPGEAATSESRRRITFPIPASDAMK